MLLALSYVWGSIFIKVKIDIDPVALFGVELSASGSEETVPSVNVCLGLGKECGFGSIWLLSDKEAHVIDESLEGLF